MPGDTTHASFEGIPNNTAASWWNDPCLRWNVFFTLGCMICPFYLGYDQSLLTGLQALPQWVDYFGHPSSNELGLIASCLFIPGIVLGFPAAWISNRWGRKWCVLIGSVLIIAGGLWNALCTTRVQFMISRVIVGGGGSMTKVAAPALLHETAHPRLRSTAGTMYYGFYYVGSLLSSILCVVGVKITGEWGWRLPCIAMIIGPILVISMLVMAPESPRLLIKQGRTNEALAILAKYHANGDTNDALVKWELQEIEQVLEMEEVNNKSSYFDFLKTPGNRKRLWVSLAITVGVNWVGNGIVSYYLTPALKAVGISKPIQLVSINAGLAAWNLIIAEIAGYNCERIGRRPLFLISTIGMIISYAFVMGFSAGFAETHSSHLGIAAIPFLFFFYGSYDVAWTPMNYSYATEIMPFNLRVKGMAIYVSVQNMANAVNQWVNPIALAAIGWKYYAVYIGIDIGYVLLIYFYFPETKKLTIEEISLVFDYGTKDGRKKALEAMKTLGTEDKKTGDQGEDIKPMVIHNETK